MQYTKFVLSLRNLFSAYHEPPLLSKQQSDRLLQGLKASFRAKLDDEYGHLPAVSHNEQSIVPNGRARHLDASRHIKSILTHPVVNHGTQLTPSAPLSSERDPMEFFDHAVSKGLMTVKAATGCLIAQSKLSSFASGSSHASADTGLRIIRWIHSSEAGTELTFLDNPQFVRVLLPFLLAEGLEGAAWEWITRLISDADLSCDRRLRTTRASRLLSALIRAKLQGIDGSLNAAIATLLEAEQRYCKNPLLPDIMRSAWRAISWRSTVEARNQTAPSEKLFDAHIEVSNRFHRSVTIEKAHLHLCHPSHPTDVPALQFFDNRQALRTLTQKLITRNADLSKLGIMDAVLWIIHLGNDTVNHLQQSGRTQKAHDVTNLLCLELADVFSDASNPAPT